MRGKRKTRYYLLWRNKWITAHAETIDDMINGLEGGAEELRKMRDAGIVLDGGAEDDYAYLVTEDPEVAEKFGLIEEEFDEEDYDEDYDEDDEEDTLSGRNGHGGT